MKMVDIVTEGLIASVSRSTFCRKVRNAGFNVELHGRTVVVIGPFASQQVTLFQQLLSVTGWYVAVAMVGWTEISVSGWKAAAHQPRFRVHVEPKYDEIIIDLPPMLYHAAPAYAFNKIKTVGLLPRAGCRRSYHPERVYMATSLHSVKELIGYFQDDEQNVSDTKRKYRESGYAIFALPYEAAKNYRWFIDPNFADTDAEGFPRGIYTPSGITRYALQVVTPPPPRDTAKHS